jgi:Polyketide cyclase / dehydrase and lipid transport
MRWFDLAPEKLSERARDQKTTDQDYRPTRHRALRLILRRRVHANSFKILPSPTLEAPMKFEHSLDIAADPAKIYQLYADVAAWPKWDPEVLESSINGAFASGSVGSVKPKGGPKSEMRFMDVKPNTSFAVQCKLPLCLMRFEHELVAKGSASTTATHRVMFSGFLAPLFGRLIGNGIKRTLPATMEGLKRAAEAEK